MTLSIRGNGIQYQYYVIANQKKSIRKFPSEASVWYTFYHHIPIISDHLLIGVWLFSLSRNITTKWWDPCSNPQNKLDKVNWLVVEPYPSEKYESVGMMKFPIYGKIKSQTTNQLILPVFQSDFTLFDLFQSCSKSEKILKKTHLQCPEIIPRLNHYHVPSGNLT